MLRIPWLPILALISTASFHSAFGQHINLDRPQSHIDVVVTATGDSFVGHLEKYRAQIDLQEGTLTPKEAVVTWNFTDLKTGKAKRDQAMLDWLEHDKTPQGSFVLKKWETRANQTWAVGQLAFHGVTNSLSMPVTVTQDQDQIRIHGEAEMDYREHQLKIIRMMLLFTVDPKVKVTFDLKGRLE